MYKRKKFVGYPVVPLVTYNDQGCETGVDLLVLVNVLLHIFNLHICNCRIAWWAIDNGKDIFRIGKYLYLYLLNIYECSLHFLVEYIYILRYELRAVYGHSYFIVRITGTDKHIPVQVFYKVGQSVEVFPPFNSQRFLYRCGTVRYPAAGTGIFPSVCG
jgi:hypothetical protein